MNTSVSREPSTLRECDARLQPPSWQSQRGAAMCTHRGARLVRLALTA